LKTLGGENAKASKCSSSWVLEFHLGGIEKA
jgi:hypothetical protein